jgi:glycosyltransferase involved in cell wall biosynthesis
VTYARESVAPAQTTARWSARVASDGLGKIRVLHLLDGLPAAGTALQVREYLRRSARHRFDHVVLNLTEGAVASVIASERTRVISLGVRNKISPRLILGLVSVARQVRPHILHNYLFQPNIFGTILGRLLHIPIIVVEERGIEKWKKKRHAWACRMIYPWATRVVANSQAVCDTLAARERLNPLIVDVLPTGFDAQTFLPTHAKGRSAARDRLALPPDAFAIGTVTRLFHLKGNDLLLRAMVAVVSSCPKARLLIVGDGPERESLRKLAEGLGLAGVISFLGLRSDVSQLLPAMDVFVSASREEGLPGAIQQAMACGLPVVATAVGGVRELIRNDECGLVVPSENVERLSSAILALVRSPELRTRLAQNAMHAVECFDWDRLAPMRDEFYLRIWDETFHTRMLAAS